MFTSGILLIMLGVLHYRLTGLHKEAKRTNDLLEAEHQRSRLILDNLEMICHDAQFRTNRELGR